MGHNIYDAFYSVARRVETVNNASMAEESGNGVWVRDQSEAWRKATVVHITKDDPVSPLVTLHLLMEDSGRSISVPFNNELAESDDIKLRNDGGVSGTDDAVNDLTVVSS